MPFDHQKVRIVACTQPEIEDATTAEDLVSYCARVSNPDNQNNYKTADRLLRYMINKKHWSPFEMVNVVVEIQTTRDIGRQILRHRSFSFQEFSQRYAVVDNGSFVTRETRLQDTKNRQNSLPNEDEKLEGEWQSYQEALMQSVYGAYKWAIDSGIAKEQARAILPEGMTMSRMYMSGSLRSWIHYCQVRNDPGVTQAEHVDIAGKIWDLLIERFPSLKAI